MALAAGHRGVDEQRVRVVRVVQRLPIQLQQADLGVDDCLAGTGLDEAALADPRAAVTPGHEFEVIRNLLRRLGAAHPGLAIEAGSRYHLALHGAWGLAIATSRTVREAADIGLRYGELGWVFVTFTFAEVDGEAVLGIASGHIPADVRTFLVERNSAATQVVIRDVLGTGLPLTDVCRELLDRRRARAGVTGAVREALVRGAGVQLSLGEVAGELGTSARTLSRRLEEEQSSFRALVDEVRQTLADELPGTGMSTQQVADRLGYAEPASFIRAFRRWSGTTPQAYRRGAHRP